MISSELMPTEAKCGRWSDFLERARAKCGKATQAIEVRGTLTRLTGLVLEASGIRVPVGSQCVVTMKIASAGTGRSRWILR